jgi:RNA polymerase sigma factor (sigma-70 family)
VSRRRDAEFREFYGANQPDVAGYCLALTGDPHVADELAQEAMTETYVRWHRLHTPRGYAFRVARNLANDHARKRHRELATWSDIAAHALPAPESDGAVWDAVRRLPAHLRDTLLLHYLYDLSVADVATALDKPLGTVKRRLHEGRGLLGNALEDAR